MWPFRQHAVAPIELGVNIDHIATLRNVRGTSYPDVLEAALIAEEAGADLITLHLREDRRHIRDTDVWTLRAKLRSRMNLECALTEEMLDIACAVKPYNVCLVPERRAELTTEGGLDVVAQLEPITKVCQRLQAAGIHTSLFIDPDVNQVEAAYKTGTDAIELHTGCYANATDSITQTTELQRIQNSIQIGLQYGLRINAGHGLHYQNVTTIAALPGIAELNIGHAIVAHALFAGWRTAVNEMKNLMLQARITENDSVARMTYPVKNRDV